MGLDMCLYGATIEIDRETGKPVIKLEEVAYWSKHNAIHNWMIKNIQNNVDNKAMYSLDEVHLKKLLLTCNKVLSNPTVENAMNILPTLNGLFFGGTDLTDYLEFENYIDGLKYTVKVLKNLLENDKFEYYYYQASW